MTDIRQEGQRTCCVGRCNNPIKGWQYVCDQCYERALKGEAKNFE